MTEEPWLDDLRAASHHACRALETQVLAMNRALKGRLRPAERRRLRATCDYIGRRVALWRELLGDEPEIVADLDMLVQRLKSSSLGGDPVTPRQSLHPLPP